jgi:nitrite reductase/ring-hydroxylating ferredoxin subunit/uncharacterized membrane protein
MGQTPTAAAATFANTLAERLEGVAFLDRPGKAIGKAVRTTLEPGGLKDVLSGTWLGHSLHPILVQVVIGSWASASLLDLMGPRGSEAAAERLIAAGIVAYPPTAMTGVTDWADSEIADDAVRRLGLIHAGTNATALALYAASLAARRNGSRERGTRLALAGAAVLCAGGWLGGHLAYVKGVGVDQTAFEPGPEDWTPVLATAELADGRPIAAEAAGTPILLFREGGRIHALHDRCTHRGCSLATGQITDGAVTCRCHGSRFALEDGRILRGPATAPQPAFDARLHDDRVEVRRRRGSQPSYPVAS